MLRRSPIGLAALAALNLLFSGLSTACVASVDVAAPYHHHHSSQGTTHHSGFCAWACQVNPASAVLSWIPTLPTLELSFSPAPFVAASLPVSSLVFLPSRAPPR